MRLIKSPNPLKKYRAIFDNGKHTDFGAAGYSDFTHHHDVERRNRYDMRHKRHEDWNNPYTAGALSKWILWNKPTLSASLADFKRRFGFN